MGCAVRYDDAFQKEVREQWFPNHIAKFTEHPDGTKILEWRNKSGTSVYWFTAVLRNGALCIFGDIGEAIYRWYPDVFDWEFFADTGIGYFESKCCASESGRRYYEWDQKVALDAIADHIRSETENAEGDDAVVDRPEQIENRAFVQKWQELSDEGGDEASESEDAWLTWCNSCYDDVTRLFGDDCMEWVPGCGRVISNRCVAHLIGIQMALEQRGKPNV